MSPGPIKTEMFPKNKLSTYLAIPTVEYLSTLKESGPSGKFFYFMKKIKIIPEFNKNCSKKIIDAHIVYYKKHDDGRMEIFARYFFNYKELVLNHDLFMTLENMFGEHMTYVIDWFNNEFGQDATGVGY